MPKQVQHDAKTHYYDVKRTIRKWVVKFLKTIFSTKRNLSLVSLELLFKYFNYRTFEMNHTYCVKRFFNLFVKNTCRVQDKAKKRGIEHHTGTVGGEVRGFDEDHTTH